MYDCKAKNSSCLALSRKFAELCSRPNWPFFRECFRKDFSCFSEVGVSLILHQAGEGWGVVCSRDLCVPRHPRHSDPTFSGPWRSLMPALGKLLGLLLFVVIVCPSQHLGDTML